MTKLTRLEKQWLDALNKLLAECPSDRLGFYTTGDAMVYVYNRQQEDAINALMDENKASDFCLAVNDRKAGLGIITFPSNVHSTAG